MYAFFQKHLGNPGSSKDLQVELLNPEQLQVTVTGQVVTALKGATVFSLNKERVQQQIAHLDLKRTESDGFLEDIPELAARHSGFHYPEQFGKPVFSGRFVKPDYVIEKYLVEGSGEYMLPVLLLKPHKRVVHEIVMMVHTEGLEHAINKDNLARELVMKGHTVLLMDLPGTGSLGPGYLKGDSYINGISYNQWFAAILTGGSFVGLRAEDILRIVHFIKEELKEYSAISAMAVGPVGCELLHAAAFEPDIRKVCLVESLLSYADIAFTRFYKTDYIPFTVAGAIEDYDLTDLVASICPREVLVINPITAEGLALNKNKIREFMDFPIKIFSEEDVPEKLELLGEVDHHLTLEKISSWLK
jgi:hypothetical protein